MPELYDYSEEDVAHDAAQAMRVLRREEGVGCYRCATRTYPTRLFSITVPGRLAALIRLCRRCVEPYDFGSLVIEVPGDAVERARVKCDPGGWLGGDGRDTPR